MARIVAQAITRGFYRHSTHSAIVAQRQYETGYIVNVIDGALSRNPLDTVRKVVICQLILSKIPIKEVLGIATHHLPLFIVFEIEPANLY